MTAEIYISTVHHWCGIRSCSRQQGYDSPISRHLNSPGLVVCIDIECKRFNHDIAAEHLHACGRNYFHSSIQEFQSRVLFIMPAARQPRQQN